MMKNSVDFKSSNPYTLSFGKKPSQSIPRTGEINSVLESFLNEPSTHQAYMITGVRGNGKTVLMTEIRNEFKNRSDWETVELSTSQNLLLTLAQTLYEDDRFTKILKQGGGFEILGFGVQLNGDQDQTAPLIAIKNALEKLKKRGKKLLICIDEIVVNDSVKEFASIFQILIRDDLPIYLLMTGLYDNISNLMNEKNLTFLYRTPQIRINPLNLGAVAENYRTNLGISVEDSEKMASLTRGYSFAFQVLGYFTFKHKGDYQSALPECKHYLEDYAYEKIWSELSRTDKLLLYSIVMSTTGKAKDIREIAGMNNNKYAPYRDRLIKKMLVNGDEYGYLKLTLPLIEDFIRRSYRLS